MSLMYLEQSMKFKVESLHSPLLSCLTHSFPNVNVNTFPPELTKLVQKDYKLINKVRMKKKVLQDLIFRSHEFLLIWEDTAQSSEEVIYTLYQGCLFQMPLLQSCQSAENRLLR